jgi:hypothetical protein
LSGSSISANFCLGLLPGHLDPAILEVALDEIAHPLLDLRQVLRGEAGTINPLKIVVETALGIVEQSRSDTEPGSRDRGREPPPASRWAVEWR